MSTRSKSSPGNSVKRSDVTRWKQGYNTPSGPPYFILWKAVTSLGETKVI